MRLAEDRFYNDYPSIIITAKGQPDVATRLFLRKLKLTLKIPVLALVDSDPYGLKILSVYMKGSMNMSYDSRCVTRTPCNVCSSKVRCVFLLCACLQQSWGRFVVLTCGGALTLLLRFPRRPSAAT
eukprot:GHRQ01021298.1.p5 GENE.GHRQ01021298.1~~GHRQ01021298.1.p5  ORF type:complete len:126 (+),score=39.81 GHRQ01021298.1:490-867(+)